MDGPWGKPGPGGAIWRNPRDIGLNFTKSMGWTDNEIFTTLHGDQKLYKRSSLTLPQVKRDDDTREQESQEKENIKPSNVEKLPDIKHSNGSNVSPEHRKSNGKAVEKEEKRRIEKEAKQQQHAEKETKKHVAKEVTKEGNGRKEKGRRSPKKKKFVKRLSNGDRVQRRISSSDESDNGVPQAYRGETMNSGEKKPTPEAAILRVTGGVELVPLLARRRRVGARTLPSSDVTRPPDQNCQWREIDVEYLRDLKHQMRVKCEIKEEKRKDSAESVRRHHETWESLWGRPGHGAPAARGKYARSNLAQLLYVVPLPKTQL